MNPGVRESLARMAAAYAPHAAVPTAAMTAATHIAASAYLGDPHAKAFIATTLTSADRGDPQARAAASALAHGKAAAFQTLEFWIAYYERGGRPK
jgi:hypothetical protein